MKRIGLLSDTHGYLDPAIFGHFEKCDEVWHAGDIGTLELADELARFKPFRAVYGNVDGAELRRCHPLDQRFDCLGIDVWMTHIGGYPGAYDRKVKEALAAHPPGLFVCGHSHILKVMRDQKLGLVHINPGAAGHIGWHLVRTVVRFTIDAGKIRDLEAIDLGQRGRNAG
jgi:hypothetical protein